MLEERALVEIQNRARSGTRGLVSLSEHINNLADARAACGDVDVLLKALREAYREIGRLQSEAATFGARLAEREREVQRAQNLWAERGHQVETLLKQVEGADEARKAMRQSVLEAVLELQRAGGPPRLMAKFEGILQGPQ